MIGCTYLLFGKSPILTQVGYDEENEIIYINGAGEATGLRTSEHSVR
jgi:hypothetical protein